MRDLLIIPKTMECFAILPIQRPFLLFYYLLDMVIVQCSGIGNLYMQ